MTEVCYNLTQSLWEIWLRQFHVWLCRVVMFLDGIIKYVYFYMIIEIKRSSIIEAEEINNPNQ